jgi:hypothetical protein
MQCHDSNTLCLLGQKGSPVHVVYRGPSRPQRIGEQNSFIWGFLALVESKVCNYCAFLIVCQSVILGMEITCGKTDAFHENYNLGVKYLL